MWLSRYFLWFLGFSLIGWVYESIFAVVKTGKWEARGFLYGPVCPIYGTGACAACALAEYVMPGRNIAWWAVFLIGFFGSFVLEYGTSLALEKLFHAYWWDYSDMPMNLHGRVCLPASLAFGGAAVLVVYVLYPFAARVTGQLSPVVTELLALLGMAVLAGDLTLTVSALTGFAHAVRMLDEAVNKHMAYYVDTMSGAMSGAATAAAQRIAEERERFSRESIEHTVSHMSRYYTGAIRRIKGLRLPSAGTAAAFAERVFAAVRRRVSAIGSAVTSRVRGTGETDPADPADPKSGE